LAALQASEINYSWTTICGCSKEGDMTTLLSLDDSTAAGGGDVTVTSRTPCVAGAGTDDGVLERRSLARMRLCNSL